MRALASPTAAARSRALPAAALATLSFCCALAATGCRRETDGQTAVLLDLTTGGPIDCVTLEEGPAAQGDAGGQALSQTQSLQIGGGLPDAFLKSFRTAKTSALIYSGRDLGDTAVFVQAEGHRGGCGGAVVARYGPATLAFTQGKVTPVEAQLALLGTDADHDGFAAGDDCNDNDPTVYPGAPELCDGKDHSCSGVLDKGCPCTAGASRACYPLGLSSPTIGVGLCKKGAQACVAGKWDGFCVGARVPAPEQCDDLDHDCDGVKGLPSCPCKLGDTRRCYTKGPMALAGVGRCAWGQQSCGTDGFFGLCQGDVAPLPEELCNGIDDNCNGEVDEETDASGHPLMARPACAKTEGVCAGAKRHCAFATTGGFAACTDADYNDAAKAHGSLYGPDVNFCDQVDHDCDGTIDTGCPSRSCAAQGAGFTRDCYGPGLGSPTLQHGPCKKGTQTCGKTNGQLLWGACAGEVEPQAEVCNGVDDDCNGVVDDLPKGEGTACDTGRPGVCADGVRRCGGGALSCASITQPSAEICDGLDNDCNGKTDELWNKQTDPAHCGGPNECRACPSGDACCSGRCSDFKTDSLNCGACGRVCGAGQGCCAGACVALDTNADCGVCGLACPGGFTCRAGLCLGPTETICNDGIDNDGNGLTDCQDPSCQSRVCDSTGGTCNQGTCQHETICDDGIDNDADGLIDCQDPDCLHRRCVNHGVCTAAKACIIEICNNGIDDNGDGLIDCQDPLACPAPLGTVGAIEQCCSLKWTDTQADLANCGACGNDCRAGHASPCGSIACVAGQCKYGTVPDRTACASGVCCKGNCVQDKETSCTDGVDNNCDGKTDCQDALTCPAPGGLTAPACCGTAWTDTDHGDLANCGGCGKLCAPPVNACAVAVCKPGGVCSGVIDCNRPGCDGVSCTSAGVAGKCSASVCCTGCLQGDGSCVAADATSGAACGLFGAACATCPPPTLGTECQLAGCSAGACGSFNKPEGTSCAGGKGTCYGGGCYTCPGASCGGSCCGPGETCSGSGPNARCTCDTSGTASDCTKRNGCCSAVNRCLLPSFDNCSQCGKVFCSGGGELNGFCLDQTACGKCSPSVVTCGGNECLTPPPFPPGNGFSGHLNICSTPTNLESCLVSGGPTGRCTCALGDPTSCPGGPTGVCKPQSAASPACFSCGDLGTGGLPCKSGGTCREALSLCF